MEVRKHLIEILLNLKIDRIEKPAAEKSLKTDFISHGIRFDVYVKDGNGRSFDIEIQTTHSTSLAKRARYYQGLMDVDSLVSGADYSELNESYVIFLCMEDAFGSGLPVYDFHQVCKQNSDILFNDGTHKVFFNASKYDKMPTKGLREFFKFLNGLNAASDFTDQLEQKVRYAKTNAQWRHRFMTWEQEMRIQVKEKSEALAKIIAKEMVEDRVNAMRADIEKEAKEMAAEKVEETAKKLLAEKIAPEVVARCTGLSLEQVKKLASKS